MQIVTIADIAGDGAAHQILSAGGAKWIQFAVTGTGTGRIGDSNVSTTRGIPVASGAGQFFPPSPAEIGDLYILSQIYYAVPIGATMSIVYAV